MEPLTYLSDKAGLNYVTEYQLAKGRCTCCKANHLASLPEGITWGITGPNLTSFMSQMTSKYKLSRRGLQEFLKEQFDFQFSLGSVFNKQKLVNKALENPISELLNHVKESPCVNMDETGHRRDGTSQWLWGIMSTKAAYFSIEKSRGKKTIHHLMEGYENIVISDRYAAYNYFDSSKRQIFRVEEDVTALNPHRPGRAQLTHPVLHFIRFARSWLENRDRFVAWVAGISLEHFGIPAN